MTSLEEVVQENSILKKRIEELEETLKKYTNTERHQRYYENHKPEVKERAKSYMENIRKTNPEKIKEWRRNAYLKEKEKAKAKKSESTTDETSG